MSIWRSWLKTLLPWRETASASQPSNPSESIHPASASPLVSGLNTSSKPNGSSQILLQLEYVRLLPIKEWVQQTVSPYAWDRVVIRSLSRVRAMGLSLGSLLNPLPHAVVPSSILQVILASLREMYGIELPQDVLYKAASV
ncbi:MAG: hypothetical protein NZ958_05640 [Bacteroidia bacterium]|nr:hypothetical protein [Bacteroidia bacterium]MDW8088937.1 hypothetical protein [Bacteroidia bacterium]